MANAELHLMDHPLILHKITMLRSVETDTKDFRQLVYTNRNHSIYGGNTRNHLFRQCITFFEKELK